MGTTGRSIGTITWTGEQVVADDVVPDTDTIVYITKAESIYVQWDTTNVSTDAPNFDFHVESSYDGTNWTTGHYSTIASGVLEDDVDSDLVAPGPKQIRFRLDVNNDTLAANEYVELEIFVISTL